MSRLPIDLLQGIEAHMKLTGKEPRLLTFRDSFVKQHAPFFNQHLHSLCCGKGSIFNGIPAIVTPSVMVEDYLICY